MTLPYDFSHPTDVLSAFATTQEGLLAEKVALDADVAAWHAKFSGVTLEIDKSNTEAMQYQVDDAELQQREVDLNAEKIALDAAITAHRATPPDPNDAAAVAAYTAEAAVNMTALAELNIRINQRNQDQAACDARHAEHISQAHRMAAKYDALVDEKADYDARATALRTRATDYEAASTPAQSGPSKE